MIICIKIRNKIVEINLFGICYRDLKVISFRIVNKFIDVEFLFFIVNLIL